MKHFLTSLFTLTGCWNVWFRLLLLSHVFTLLTMCIVTSRTLFVDDFWVFLSQVLCRRNTSRVEQSSTWARGVSLRPVGSLPTWCGIVNCATPRQQIDSMSSGWLLYFYNTWLACCQTVYSASLAFYRNQLRIATRHVLGECCAVSSHQVKYLETQWSSHRAVVLSSRGWVNSWRIFRYFINQYLLRVELWAAVTMNYKHSILFLKIETGKFKFVEGIQ